MTSPSLGGPAPAEVPVCPRHPDRVSYVRCQRCGRPTCTECQRTAAVGVHCVDCVREASRNAPVPRTAFGAPLRGGRPVVTLTLVGLCVVSFLLQRVTGLEWTQALIFAPFIGEVEPWRFVTAAFVHDPSFIFHLAFNMYALWILGEALENALGRARFLALYLLSAVGGNLMVTLFASPVAESWYTGVLGASGAVFGLFGALLLVLRRLGRSARQVVVIIGINAVLGFVVPRIAWEAHLGGLLVGAALGAAYAYAPRARRREVAIGATALTAVVLVVLIFVRYSTV